MALRGHVGMLLTVEVGMEPLVKTPLGTYYTAAGIAEAFGFDEEEVLEWAEAGYFPHLYIGECGPYFKMSEAKRWVKENKLFETSGMPLPKPHRVLLPVTELDILPAELTHVPNLQRLPLVGAMSDIYFLTLNHKVVYVGQSVSVLNRLATHVRDGVKEFDPAGTFFLPCPEKNLLSVEREYIRLLNPPLNRAGVVREPRESAN